MTDPMPTPMSWKDLPGAPDDKTVLARLDDLSDGGVRLLTLNNGGLLYKIILLRSDEQIFAYVNRCAHFGVPLAEKPEHLYAQAHQSINCAVHYARYRWQDGLCDRGECKGEALIAIPVKVINGEVVISESTSA